MNDSLRHAFSYCPSCGNPMGRREEGGLVRPSCGACGFVQYLNPAPAAAVIILRGNRICLVKRRFPPRAGQWTLPAGFIEYDEDVRAAAVREVAEETGLDVQIVGLHDVLTGVLPPDRPVLLAIFRGEELGGELSAGDDAADVDFFPLEAPPDPIAFSTHRKVLADLLRGRKHGRRDDA